MTGRPDASYYTGYAITKPQTNGRSRSRSRQRQEIPQNNRNVISPGVQTNDSQNTRAQHTNNISDMHRIYRDVLTMVPNEWTTPDLCSEVVLREYSREYERVHKILNERCSIQNGTQYGSITRIQNVHAYGQFLLRKDLLAHYSMHTQYYIVRRFFALPKPHKCVAIKYNLDARRWTHALQPTVTLRKELDAVGANESVFVVRVVTDRPYDSSIRPSNCLEYYIEYVADVIEAENGGSPM